MLIKLRVGTIISTPFNTAMLQKPVQPERHNDLLIV